MAVLLICLRLGESRSPDSPASPEIFWKYKTIFKYQHGAKRHPNSGKLSLLPPHHFFFVRNVLFCALFPCGQAWRAAFASTRTATGTRTTPFWIWIRSPAGSKWWPNTTARPETIVPCWANTSTGPVARKAPRKTCRFVDSWETRQRATPKVRTSRSRVKSGDERGLRDAERVRIFCSPPLQKYTL